MPQADLTEPEESTLVESSDIHHTGSKQNGNDAETWVQEQYDLEGQNEQFPDFAHDVWDPRNERPGEVKSCQIRYNGSGGRGRFQIWDYAHERLLEADGFYVFVVHEPKVHDFHVYFHRPLSAREVDERIRNWHAIDHNLRPDEAHRTEVSQSAIFSDISVNRIEPDPEPEDPGTEITFEGPGADPAAGIPQVERVKEIKNIIERLEEQNGGEPPKETNVLVEAGQTGIDPDTAQHHIEELRKKGEIYTPEKGRLRSV